MQAKELESFPPGNPFHHDAFSCGARLRDVTVVDMERDEKYANIYIMFGSPRLGQGLYIVNADTGERIGIEL